MYYGGQMDHISKVVLEADNPLGRFVYLETNTWCLLWAVDCTLLMKRKALAWTRRALNLALIGLCFVVFEYFLKEYENWCCYPSSTSVQDENRGTCNFPGAPIQSSPDYQACDLSKAPSGQMITAVVMIAVALTSVLLHVYNSSRFVHDLRTDVNAHETALLNCVQRHAPAKQAATMSAYIQCMTHQHTKSGREKGPAPVSVLLDRVRKLLRPDPIGIWLGTSQFVLHNHKLLVGVWCNTVIWICNILVYQYVSKPLWEEKCCKPAELHDPRFGSCTDPLAAIQREPDRQKCGPMTFTWAVWTFWGVHIFNWLLGTLLALWEYHACARVVDKRNQVFMEDLATQIAANPTLQENIKLGMGHRADQRFTDQTLAIWEHFNKFKKQQTQQTLKKY